MKIPGILVLLLVVCVSSVAAAQGGTTLLVKTDMSCNWKLDGRSMGVLNADGPTVVLVSPGEHLIEAAATEGVATLRTNVEVDKVEKTVGIQLKGRNDQQSKMHHFETPKEAAKADAAKDVTWTDPATGLMWTRKDNGSDVDWAQARAYCSKLQLAGYSDWRLANTEELQGIYDPTVKGSKEFDNGVTYEVHIKGNLNLTGQDWSGSEGEDVGKPYETSWEFTFTDVQPWRSGLPNPAPNFTHFSFDMRALCVRHAAAGAAVP